MASARLKDKPSINRTHGMRKSKEYNTWRGMKERCGNPNHKDYKHYGGRGIKVCDRWFRSFENFYEDMGPKPSKKHSIDRVDLDGHYSKENCRWVTHSVQVSNTRVRSDSRTGVKGVYQTRSGRFASNIRVNGKVTHLGTFDTMEEAKKARAAAEPQALIDRQRASGA